MDAPPHNPPGPLDRRPDEPSKAHTALCDYAALGPGRSIDKLLALYTERTRSGHSPAVPTQRRTTLGGWSSRYAWQERVAAYDEAQARAQLATREAERARRAAQFNESIWAAAEAGLARVRELLEQTAISSTRTESYEADENGRRVKVVTIREAPKGSLRDVAALLKAVSEAGRLVAGEPTSHQRIDLRVPTAEELERMSAEELDALEQELAAHLGR